MLERYVTKNRTVTEDNNGNIYYYYDINNAEKDQILNEFKIDAHTLASALDQEEIARFEIENENIILIWKVPTTFKLGEVLSFNVVSVGFVIMKDKLIIISTEKNDYLNEKFAIEVNSFIDVVLAYQNNIIRHFIEHLKVIKLMSRDIQKKINKSMENRYLIQMFSLSEILIFYLEAINSNKVVLNKFKQFLTIKNCNYNENFYNDIVIENEQASKQAEIYSQIFAGLMDARGTIVNNNMNILIKNLTVINIIFLPLNLIASVFGMSEYTSFTSHLPWQVSYTFFGITMAVIGWLTFLLINRIEKKEKHKGD